MNARAEDLGTDRIPKDKLAAFEKLLQDIIRLAMEKGIVFGKVQVVDSTHSVADVNVGKDKRRQSKGQAPRDRNAHWGVKRSYKKRNGQEERVYFYGYKAHAASTPRVV